MLLIVDNASGELMTGAFTNVRLELPGPDNAVNVPASALIFDQSGSARRNRRRRWPRRAEVGDDLARSRQGGRDCLGLTANDQIITTPPDGIASGDQVRIAGGAGAPFRVDEAGAGQRAAG